MSRIATWKSFNHSDTYVMFDSIAPEFYIANEKTLCEAVGNIKNKLTDIDIITDLYSQNFGKLSCVYFLISDACNLRCDYCFVDDYLNNSTMNKNIVDMAIFKIKQ